LKCFVQAERSAGQELDSVTPELLDVAAGVAAPQTFDRYLEPGGGRLTALQGQVEGHVGVHPAGTAYIENLKFLAVKVEECTSLDKPGRKRSSPE